VLLPHVSRMFQSNHMAYILSILLECDITGGDIKEVKQYVQVGGICTSRRSLAAMDPTLPASQRSLMEA
jgi:hypothetical protein